MFPIIITPAIQVNVVSTINDNDRSSVIFISDLTAVLRSVLLAMAPFLNEL